MIINHTNTIIETSAFTYSSLLKDGHWTSKLGHSHSHLRRKMKGSRSSSIEEATAAFYSSFLAWSKLVIKKSPHAKGYG